MRNYRLSRLFFLASFIVGIGIFSPNKGLAQQQCNVADCQDMSGGNVENVCRTAQCGQVTGQNPTGCDYNAIASTADNQCKLCSEPRPPDFTACGNGICEEDEGEDCTSCAVDCLVPGFDSACPVSQTTLNNACPNPPAIELVTFSGPPYNVNGQCEDGEVCTNNLCNGNGQCDVSLKACSFDLADFCCPAGCNPPPAGQDCGETQGCDVDCIPKEECPFCGNSIIDEGEECDRSAVNSCGVAGCNDSTCQCNPPFFVCLQGSGNITSGTDPNCNGSACSLNKNATVPSFAGMTMLSLVVIALMIARRRNAN